MSNIDFPNTPNNGDTYSFDGKQWTFDGEKWETSGGSKGQKGEPGPGGGDKGAKGEPGVGGSTGPSGSKGEKGESGPQGAVGPQGSAGAQGAAGPTGPSGAKGEAGDKGEPTTGYVSTTGNQSIAGIKTFTSDVDIDADVDILGNVTLTGSTGDSVLAIGGVRPELRFYEAGQYVGFRPQLSGNQNQLWYLPTDDGTSGQALVTDGSGTLSFATISGSSQWTPTGSDIYYNGGNVAVGSTSSNYPLLVTSTPSHGVLTRFDGSGVANTNSVEIDIVGPQSNGQLNMGVGGDNINDGTNNVDDKAFIVATGLSGLNLRADSGYVQITANGVASSNEVARFSSSGVQFNQAYTFPTSDGNANEVLKTNGSGTLSFTDPKLTTFLYSTTSDLPSASTYHGAIGHVHAEGALYFAHGGSWNKLQNDIPNIANSAQGVDVTGMVATSGVNISTGGQLNAAGTSIDFQSATISFSGASVSGLNGEIRDVVEVGVPETFSTTNAASGVTALDCNNGHIFYLTSPSGDVTANFTNLYLNANYATNLSVVVNQGATPREVTAIQIEGTGQTINWQGGSAPTGTANGIDVFSFTILRDSTSYIVLGQMVDFA